MPAEISTRSAEVDVMAELLNHGHCKVCGRAVRVGEDTCGPTDAANLALLDRRRKRTALLFYGAGAFMILLLLSQLLPQFL